jgi:glycosyltransferase involved in cell wall biosynthesis
VDLARTATPELRSDDVLAAAGSSGYQDVYVIVRCFNEAQVVNPVVRGLRGAFQNVLGIDDGSTDSSAELMRSAGATVVRHAVNLGAGAALQTGLEFALLDPNARYFLCFDADGQHRVADAVAMAERVHREQLDILVGSRFLGERPAMPHARRLMLRAARTFERLSTGIRLTDAHNGLRVFSRRFAVQIDLTMNDMAYATELSSLIAHCGLPYAEHPVTIDYSRYSGHKGQRSINSINIATDIWMHHMLRGHRT